MAIIIGTAVGYGIDRLAGTSPWGFLIGFFLGLAAGIRAVFRTVASVSKDERRMSEPDPFLRRFERTSLVACLALALGGVAVSGGDWWIGVAVVGWRRAGGDQLRGRQGWRRRRGQRDARHGRW